MIIERGRRNPQRVRPLKVVPVSSIRWNRELTLDSRRSLSPRRRERNDKKKDGNDKKKGPGNYTVVIPSKEGIEDF
ncbi:MAG TPA: hypothetical protein VEF33_08610 [Syntrophales bacterium]|nr:hypothetical protein [Syntrophales bacterium]